MSISEITLEPATIHNIPLSDVLKRKRLDRGFDLADVARETRIPLRHLNALEAGDFAHLPASAYSIGFARTYARYLGLDPDVTALQFKTEAPQLESQGVVTMPDIYHESRLPDRKLLLGSLALLGVLIVAFIAYSTFKDDDLPAPENENISNTASTPPATARTAPVLSNLAAPPVADTITPPPATSSLQAPSLPTPSLPVSSLAAPVSAPTLPNVPVVGLVLRAKDDSWVKVSDGGSVSLKIGILKAGEIYVVPQVPNLYLQTGNAGGLELIYNGRLMPALGKDGEVLRNKSLDVTQAKVVAPPIR
jgi:cytoskeleton protein RodZ